MDKGHRKDEIIRLSGLHDRLEVKIAELDAEVDVFLDQPTPANEDQVIRRAGLLDRLRTKRDEVKGQIRLLLRTTPVERDNEAEEMLAEETGTDSHVPTEALPRQVPRRRSKYPEGPPMNRKVLQFLQQTGHACGYKDVLTGVDAHHQTIQNSLRDLERRGYAVKLGPNQWIASEIQIRKGELTVVE